MPVVLEPIVTGIFWKVRNALYTVIMSQVGCETCFMF